MCEDCERVARELELFVLLSLLFLTLFLVTLILVEQFPKFLIPLTLMYTTTILVLLYAAIRTSETGRGRR